ncbi:hypothetical protein ACFQRK_09970 [Parapedobacter sp. GCM10030251]|jgi:High potential iron-sulfur protein.|uniref:hypothetical protein n=1 Tax=Parapedobacter sp. GCM10030251 TaxID=3273419 RepID=UPI00361246A4
MESRRTFIGHAFSLALSLASTVALVACGGNGKSGKDAGAAADSTANPDKDALARFGGNCDDFSKLTEKDYEVRKNLGYQKSSPTEDTQCQHCNLWLPPRPNESCGGCTLFTGPIEPTGTCTYWAPRQS